MAESQTSATRRVLIVGGGITGLAAAHRVCELSAQTGQPVDLRLLEASGRLGGTILTQEQDGFLIEAGPDSFITQKPWGLALCRRLGIEDQLIQTNPEHRVTLVVRKGVLHPVPEGFLLLAPTRIWPFVTSRLFSWPGKLRMAMDLIMPRRDHGADGDESLASFVRRRFGREALERIAQPMVGGIYTADPEHLSLRATMPRFLDMETNHGSIIRASRKSRRSDTSGTPVGSHTGSQAPRGESTDGDRNLGSGARYSLFVSFARGMETLVRELESRLPPAAVHLRARVTGLEKSGESWIARCDDASAHPADAVILACPAYVSADMVRPLDAGLAAELAALEYASSATMSMAFREDQVAHPLQGFGFVVPAVEARSLIAVTFSSVKFAGRAPKGWVLMRAFLGGAMHPHVYARDDADLKEAVLRDLRELIGVRGEPRFVEIHRWPRSMPQYPVGHLDRVRRIESLLGRLPGLVVAGNAFGGVGVPDCVHSAERAVEQVLNRDTVQHRDETS